MTNSKFSDLFFKYETCNKLLWVFMNKLCESDENVSSTKRLWLCAWKKAVIETRTHTVSCCDTWWLTSCFARSLLPANNFNNFFFFLNNKQFKLCSCIQISFTGLRHRFQRHQMSILLLANIHHIYWYISRYLQMREPIIFICYWISCACLCLSIVW